MAKERKMRIVRVLKPKIKEIKTENEVPDNSELERDIAQSEDESFAHFLGSSERVAPILSQTRSTNEVPAEPAPTPRELNQPSEEHQSTVRLYDVGRNLGGNAPIPYEISSAPSANILRNRAPGSDFAMGSSPHNQVSTSKDTLSNQESDLREQGLNERKYEDKPRRHYPWEA